jgi:hypothetical protein
VTGDIHNAELQANNAIPTLHSLVLVLAETHYINLDKAVTQRRGFDMGNGAVWAAQIFTAKRLFTEFRPWGLLSL